MIKQLLPLVLLSLAACEVDLAPLSTPPPGAVADLDPTCNEITLTRGAALGIGCTDAGLSCEDLEVEVGDSSIAGAHIAYAKDLTGVYQPSQASTFVLVGKAEGTTDIIVDSCEGSVTYKVTVIAP